MVYVTLTTRNRFWHCALTALAVANGNWRGCFIHVFDDGSDDDFADAKRFLFTDLLNRGVIHRFSRVENKIGFCKGREELVDNLMEESRFLYWLHLDDDILLGPQTGLQAATDMQSSLDNRALLHLYANPWAKWTAWKGPFAKVTKIGGACFLIPRHLMAEVGNPYRGQDDGEKANADFWARVAQADAPMVIRWTQPYQCQHTGNVESTIFGHTPKWEGLYAKDFKTGRIVEVPQFPMAELRQCVKGKTLAGYVWKANANARVKVKLPAPGSQTGIRKRP